MAHIDNPADVGYCNCRAEFRSFSRNLSRDGQAVSDEETVMAASVGHRGARSACTLALAASLLVGGAAPGEFGHFDTLSAGRPGIGETVRHGLEKAKGAGAVVRKEAERWYAYKVGECLVNRIRAGRDDWKECFQLSVEGMPESKPHERK
jgi:hypothetical protein